MAYWAQLFKFIVLWLKINKLELFSELDYWTKLMQLLWVCPAERQNIHRHHQLPSELNPDLSFFSQQQAFTDTDREIALVVALTIASKIVSFKVGFKKPPSLTSYLCTHVWNRSQHIAFWPQCLVWNQKKLALCLIVKVFDLQTFSCVQLTNFWVSLIMFDYQTQSKSIAPMHDYVRRVNFTNKPRLWTKFFAFALFVRGYSFQLYCLGNSFLWNFAYF